MNRKGAAGSQRNGTAVYRCAIYTRKSSEDGLEQDFNSLDAQREACEAYILSQKSAGWIALPEMYDDGGISGGTLERPALQRLLSDIGASRIDTVVVYKVDRLTRSLNDFAKIVDAFDAKGVSFVSVTQQFNTTTSMGRLTLNMLLSFAQFEREVTGERIRDKIAASKRKGMWMGGLPPLGYDVEDRKLVINASEADIVRDIYRRYAILKSVRALKEELDSDGVVSKARLDRFGRESGGKSLARGALYLMLQNRIYRGEIVHGDNCYPGLHDAIVDATLWDEVQATLAENRVERVSRSGATAPSLLASPVYDDSGERMSPTHANKHGTRYRYYVSQSLIKRGRPKASGAACRVPAADLEAIVEGRICALLQDEAAFFNAAGAGSVDIETRKTLTEQAAALARRWPTVTHADKPMFLHVLVTRIDGKRRFHPTFRDVRRGRMLLVPESGPEDRLVSTLDLTLEPKRGVRRIEVIDGIGGRRRWSVDDKARMVEETLVPGAVVSDIARRHGLTPQQLFTWRRKARQRPAASETASPSMFLPAVVEPAVELPPEPSPRRRASRPARKAGGVSGVIEVEIDGVTVRVGRGAEAETVAAVLRALKVGA